MAFVSSQQLRTLGHSAPAFAAGLIAAVVISVGSPIDALAGESGAGAPEAAATGGMSDTLKKAAAHGTNTAVDEAARGATMGDATKKGGAAAVNRALGVPATPVTPNPAQAVEEAH